MDETTTFLIYQVSCDTRHRHRIRCQVPWNMMTLYNISNPAHLSLAPFAGEQCVPAFSGKRGPQTDPPPPTRYYYHNIIRRDSSHGINRQMQISTDSSPTYTHNRAKTVTRGRLKYFSDHPHILISWSFKTSEKTENTDTPRSKNTVGHFIADAVWPYSLERIY